jgi:hypothetical protein
MRHYLFGADLALARVGQRLLPDLFARTIFEGGLLWIATWRRREVDRNWVMIRT